MEIKITFHNMPHSPVLEQHATAKLKKIEEILKAQAHMSPFTVEMGLTANKQHPHHAARLHVKTRTFNLNTHQEGPDMYIAIDTAIDKMVAMIIKEKEQLTERTQNPDTDKKNFSR
ncbi:MAG: ribosome-associated translation inhibitor RaiA [Candidatus Babeliales bacterium]